MAPASVQVTCMEPVVYLRGQSAVGEDARGRRRQIDFDAPPSQLRGLLTMYLPRPSRIKEITITLQGKSRTDWPEGIGPNRLDTVEEAIIFRQKVILFTSRDNQSPSRSRKRASSIGPVFDFSAEDFENRIGNSITAPSSTTASPLISPAITPTTSTNNDDLSNGGKEFLKGTYNYPFSIPLPSNLPPTLHADFGSNSYTIKGHVHRAGPLTSNLSSETEVTLVHAPDENGSEEVESIVVERNWEDALRYMIVVMGKSFPVGGRVPIWAKFIPMEKVRIHRIFATLEERTAYYAKGRRVARHEVPRRWTLLKILPVSDTPSFKSPGLSNSKGILPILSENSNAILESPLAKMACAAAAAYSGAVGDEEKDDAKAQALASLADPTGPWEFTMDLEVPAGTSTRINISSNHIKSNIAVHHLVKLSIRVERLDAYGSASAESIPDNQRKLYDILIEAPIAINHSHTANAWLTLPDYWSVPPPPPPEEEEGEGGVVNGSIASSSRQSGSNNIVQQPLSTKTQSRPTSSNGRKSEARLEIERRILKHALQSVKNTSAALTNPSNGQDGTSNSKQKNKQKQQQPSPQQDTTGQRLARLSRQWLSLTASGGSNGVNSNQSSPQGSPNGYSHLPSRASSVPPPPRSAQTVITYGGPYFGDVTTQQIEEDSGLPPTYAMIDGARGSIDLPPTQRSRPDGKP